MTDVPPDLIPGTAALADAYEHLDPEGPDWLDTVAEYAATPDGINRIAHDLETARDLQDQPRVARLTIALRRGETLVESRADLARQQVAESNKPRALQRGDLDRVKATFDVADSQVIRDHAISLILAAIARSKARRDLVFIGGTALSRTYLPLLRLSEDIDLLTQADDRRTTAKIIDTAVTRALARSHGQLRWTPSLPETSGTTPAVLSTPDEATIRIQLLDARDYPAWPTHERRLIQRYTDAPPATLTTYTGVGFAASKTNTWHDRRAPRDLYDLWALGQHGHITPGAAHLYARLGPTGRPPDPSSLFDRAPSATEWNNALAHQGRLRISPDSALAEVRAYWELATR